LGATSDFDRSPWLLNTLNGTLDLHGGELRPHDPADMLTKLLYGTGANGKGVFSGTIASLLGDYGMKVRAEMLMRKNGDSILEEIAAMAGRRFALASELGEGQQWRSTTALSS
jgi:putative DNA primase/helicase